MHLEFKIQEIFTERVKNPINKRLQWHDFVYKICKSKGEYILYFKLKLYYFIYYIS